MIKLIELDSFHKFKGGIIEMTSDNGGCLETLYYSSRFSKYFVHKYSDFVLIDGTHKTNIYDLSYVVTTMVDSLGKSVPPGFLLTPSEHSESITRHINILKVTGNNCIDPSYVNTRSIMTNEGSALVKVASDMVGYHHCLCAFHINQLAIRVSLFVFNKKYIVINDCSRELIFCFMTT